MRRDVHPRKYLNTEGDYVGIPMGHLKVLEWDEVIKKYRVQISYAFSFSEMITYLSPEDMDLNYRVTLPSKFKCTCGADSVGHPGHTYYCDLDGIPK